MARSATAAVSIAAHSKNAGQDLDVIPGQGEAGRADAVPGPRLMQDAVEVPITAHSKVRQVKTLT